MAEHFDPLIFLTISRHFSQEAGKAEKVMSCFMEESLQGSRTKVKGKRDADFRQTHAFRDDGYSADWTGKWYRPYRGQ